MSVINNVLKQLDDRPSQFTPVKLSINGEEYKRSIFQPLFWGVLIILLVLALYFVYEKLYRSLVIELIYLQSTCHINSLTNILSTLQ